MPAVAEDMAAAAAPTSGVIDLTSPPRPSAGGAKAETEDAEVERAAVLGQTRTAKDEDEDVHEGRPSRAPAAVVAADDSTTNGQEDKERRDSSEDFTAGDVRVEKTGAQDAAEEHQENGTGTTTSTDGAAEPAPPSASASTSPTSLSAPSPSVITTAPAISTSPSDSSASPATAAAQPSTPSPSTTTFGVSGAHLSPAAAGARSPGGVIASPPRRSSLLLARVSSGSGPPAPLPGDPTATPAPAGAAATPAAPVKPPPPAVLDTPTGNTPTATPAPAAAASGSLALSLGTSRGAIAATPEYLRAAAGLEEFDPFATPPPPPPKQQQLAVDTNVAAGRQQGSAGGGRSNTSGASTPRGRNAGTQTPPTAAGGSGAGTPTGSASVGGAGAVTGGRRQGSGSSTDGEPQFNFAGFLKDLRTKSADPVARYLKSFLTNFSKKPFTVNEQIKLTRDFLAFISEKMKVVEPWRSQTPAEFDLALEAMEKLVMNRLYPYTFTPQLTAVQTITTDDLERDAVFAQRVRLFGWVRERHLDVPEGEAALGFLGFAEQELLKINHYKAPRDKMICILNCCKVIFGLIRHTASNGGGGEGGADAFVPILIFVVLRASPDNMLSNVEYINRFRNPEKLTGEAGYYLSSLQGAIAFIETMDASSLSNITQDEFELNVEKAIQNLPSSPTSPRASVSGASGSSGAGPRPSSDMSPFATSPGEEPARALTLPNTSAALDGTRRFFQRTGDAAKEAVSRPLSAIGKILDSMNAGDTGSESGDDDGGDDHHQPRRRDDGDDDMVTHWQPGGARDREAERRHFQPGGGMHAPGSGGGLGGGPAYPLAPANRSRLGRYPGPQGGAYDTPTRAPENIAQPPSRLLAQLGLGASPGVSEPGSREPTPTPDVFGGSPAQAISPGTHGLHSAHIAAQQQAAFDAHAQVQHQHQQQQLQSTIDASNEAYAREQARQASVLTLHQMFPALDEEIVGAVLASCGDDLGLAIDRLLEM